MKRIPYLFFLLFALVVSCGEDDSIDPEVAFIGYRYAPLNINQESIFQIDSIQYNEFTGRTDTFRHQRRELIEQAVIDSEGRNAFVVGIYERANDSDSWKKVKVIRKTRTASRLEVLDNNLQTVNLVFPVVNKVEWNVNSLNATSPVEYSYSEVNTPFTIDNTKYDSTLTINQQDEENLIERIFSEEKHAIDRGLVYRKSIQLETEINGDIRSGFEATQYLISFKRD